MGKAMMGSGEATGDDRALRAAEQAISNPLLDEALAGARGLIISIQGGEDMRLMEVDEVAMHIKEMVDPEADIIWGSTFNNALEGRIRVSVVATGIDSAARAVEAPAVAAKAEPVNWAPTPKPAPAALPAPALADLVDIATCLEAQAFQDEIAGDELLLTAERALILSPPEGAADFATLDPFGAGSAPGPRLAVAEPVRGPSLFERMAMVARGPGRHAREAEDCPPLTHLHRARATDGPRFARAA
jgi:cell division protein FtsZ